MPPRPAATRPATTRTLTRDDRPWLPLALCAGDDPDTYFPEGDPLAAPTVAQAEEAKRVCGACPVRADCLDWAITTRQDHGVLGGLTEGERASLRRGAA